MSQHGGGAVARRLQLAEKYGANLLNKWYKIYALEPPEKNR